MRALQHYTELPDIKRVIVNTHAIEPAALTQFFGTLSADWAVESLKELMATNVTQNLQLVVNVGLGPGLRACVHLCGTLLYALLFKNRYITMPGDYQETG